MTVRTYDNSTLSDFKTCMRYGYFKHIRGWTLTTPSAALIFGSAWHDAMDVLWERLATPQPDIEGLVDEAMDAFTSTWIAEGGPERITPLNIKLWSPRIPETARMMLTNYVSKRAGSLRHLTLVAAEEPFAVPILPGVYYTGRRDKLIKRSNGQHVIVEHKTTAWGTKSGFKSAWAETWSNKSQIDGYLFSAGLAYPRLSLSVWVDASLVHTSEHATFEFIPVVRTHEHLDAWLWETRYWIGMIEQHREALKVAPKDGSFMAAFPKNTNACIQYNRKCPFYDVCTQRSNPEKVEHPPIGMVERHWSPTSPEELAALIKQGE